MSDETTTPAADPVPEMAETDPAQSTTGRPPSSRPRVRAKTAPAAAPASRRGGSERLQKILSQAGIASRREAEELIAAGKVTLNGRTAVLGDKADLAVDAVKVDGKRVTPPPAEPQYYILLKKPKGYLSTRHDPIGRPTVMDLVPANLHKVISPVGRLDFDTEGLLLLTDDGDLAFRLAHPRFGCRKTYEVKVKGEPSETQVQKLRRGIVLDGKRTQPAEITMLREARTRKGVERKSDETNTWWEVVLVEGRSRQIREMFFRIGHPVQRLHRVGIGPLADPEMPLGAWRNLDEREVAALKKSVEREGGVVVKARRPRKPVGKPTAGPARASRPAGAAAVAEPAKAPSPAVAPKAGRVKQGRRPATSPRPSRPIGEPRLAPKRPGGSRPGDRPTARTAGARAANRAAGRSTAEPALPPGRRPAGPRSRTARPSEGSPAGRPARPRAARPGAARPGAGATGRPTGRPAPGRPSGSRPPARPPRRPKA